MRRLGAIQRRVRGLRPCDDERGTIAMLMMVVLVGLSLSALLVPMIISQDRSTRFDTTRVQALGAAQTGIDVTVGLIRAATSLDNSTVPVSYGNSAKLPCGPLSGRVDSTTTAAYTVTVEYFTFDPVTETSASTNAMTCVAGYGTYDVLKGVMTPSYARIISIGTVGSPVNGSTAGRTLVTAYRLKTTNGNILGGVIGVYPGANLCLDAGSGTAPVGSVVTLQVCSSSMPTLAQQNFAYRLDLTLQLLSSVAATNANGLCLSPVSAPAAPNNSVVLAQCGALGSPPYVQQWSYNDSGAYQAALSTSKTDGTLSSLCMDVAAETVNAALTMQTCGSTTTNWIPAPGVGPGAAAAPQWVNFSEFGRCLDITNQTLSSSYLIDYPCKQNPYPGAVLWNQKFMLPIVANGQDSATGQIYTTVTGNSTRYCLTSPGLAGAYVTMGPQLNGVLQPCAASSPSQTWTVHDGDPTLAYSAKYTIVDSTGLCLGLATAVSVWSTIDVDTCMGSTDQKWNASANVLSPVLTNTIEK